MQFKVTVLNHKKPVPRALVFLLPGNPLQGPSRITDDHGEALCYDGPPIMNVKDFTVNVIAAGYHPASVSAQFSTEPVHVTIVLERAEL
jgi:hypothetical protein